MTDKPQQIKYWDNNPKIARLQENSIPTPDNFDLPRRLLIWVIHEIDKTGAMQVGILGIDTL